MENIYLKRISTVATVIFGNVLYALVVRLFLLPGNLMTGGTTGIGLVVNHFTGLSISGFVLVFNIIMLLIGVAFLGKKFALTTVISSFTYPIALEAANRIFGNYVITENAMLNTIFAGLGVGIGLGVVIRTGASTGGMDIPPLVLHKYFRIPVSVSLNAFDMLILVMQVTSPNWWKAGIIASPVKSPMNEPRPVPPPSMRMMWLWMETTSTFMSCWPKSMLVMHASRSFKPPASSPSTLFPAQCRWKPMPSPSGACCSSVQKAPD